ncbi:MAG: bacillithiol biosynthesis deacetylase BshB1 [Ignavibacteriae bacterium]|nr:bacillithiol biosynthesis deacetylase BshB1 [Ignavibacteriota bacterium]
MEISQETDVLIIAAHPDDAELSCGGTIVQLTASGKSVVIADCTRGELGSRGTAELRAQETINATKILGVSTRVNLGMSDGNIQLSQENIHSVISLIRRFRPKIILFNPPYERHPDHENVHRLVRTAVFQSGLTKIETYFEDTLQNTHRPKHIFSYMQTYEFQPSFYIDISDYFDVKTAAIRAYSSQVFVKDENDENEPVTFISKPDFMEMLEARARYFGALIGVKYAEPYLAIEPVGIPSFGIWL